MNDRSLTIRLFGPLDVMVRGNPMARVRTRSVEWLLALLALRGGRAVDRAWLAGTLWPESEEGQARHNLRNDLSTLRAALGPEAERILSPSRSTLVLDLTGADVDLARFDAGIAAGDEESLRAAVEVYRGPLLEGCYEEWVVPERDVRSSRCLAALERLAEMAEPRRDHVEAVRWLRRAEALDPLRESTVRRLMAALDSMRDTASALEVYRSFRARLHEELGASPDDATRSLFEQIRARGRDLARPGSHQAAHSPPAVSPGFFEQPLPPAEPAAEPPRLRPAFNRPSHPLTPLIGRAQDTEAVRERLKRSRLVTLVGAGGVGKTRLALEIAALLNEELPGGTAWVELAPVPDGALVLPAIAAAVGIREETGAEGPNMVPQLAALLDAEPCLLALDNCEHHVAATASAADALLRACPKLILLATSRQRLGLPGEVLWRVPSLPAPDSRELPSDDDQAIESTLAYPAAQLFVERAESAMPGFRLGCREDAEAVRTICRRLDGIPLALELAAARFGPLSLPEIAARLDDRFRLLARGSHAALPRHQTLRALIDWSYDLLSPDEQALLRRLSVFAGGWTLEAAEWVAGSVDSDDGPPETADPMDMLVSLVDRSLIAAEARASETRYRMPETIREYAREKLRQAGEEEAARRRHLAYLLELAEREFPRLFGHAPDRALLRLSAEVDNVRAAIVWAQSDRGFEDHLLRLSAALWLWWSLTGHCHEGLASAPADLARAAPRDSRPAAWALLGASYLTWGAARYLGEAIVLGQESLDRFRETGDRPGLAAALLQTAHVLLLNRRLPESRALLDECLALCRELDWELGGVIVLVNLGLIARMTGESERSAALLDESAKRMALGDLAGTPSYFLFYLTPMATFLNDFLVDNPSGRALLERILFLVRQTGQRWCISIIGLVLGQVAGIQGDAQLAVSCLKETAAYYREVGSLFLLAFALQDIGNVYYRIGDYAAALPVYYESLTLFRSLGADMGVDTACNNLGATLLHLGEPERAGLLHREALGIYVRQQCVEGVAWSLERLGILEALCGDAVRAAVLLGAGSTAREEFGTPMPSWSQEECDRAAAASRAAIGDASFEDRWREGREMARSQAVAAALEERTYRALTTI